MQQFLVTNTAPLQGNTYTYYTTCNTVGTEANVLKVSQYVAVTLHLICNVNQFKHSVHTCTHAFFSHF